MKYALLVGDGMADWPLAELGNQTPLAYAKTPHMDQIAIAGRIGRVATVPAGMQPGSDVANMSLMGYNPQDYYSGRAPIEAASMGIALTTDETAFRCNFVTIISDTMIDYSAGHISTAEAQQLITLLQKKLTTATVHLYPGVSYRHLLTIKSFPEGLQCTPPHDITDKKITPYLPQGAGSQQIAELMQAARPILAASPVNKQRHLAGNNVVTDIWLWGQGQAHALPSLFKLHGITGSVISAVDLVRGLGVLAGLTVHLVPGATGYLGTNYAGKIAAAYKTFETQDFVYLHVEAPDETSHEGSLEKKIAAIEEFDTHIVGEMLRLQHERNDLRILVVPDHATPVSIKTHSAEPVPYVLSGPGITPDAGMLYRESAAQSCTPCTGPELFKTLLQP